MPTAAKLVSGILLAALGWYVATLIVPYLPPETDLGLFREISAALGLLVGWRFVGRRAAESFTGSIAFGIGGSAFLAFWMLLVFSGFEMVKRSYRKSYDSPFEALQGMIDIGIGYFEYLMPTEIAGTLIGCGAAIGIIAYLVSLRWP